LKIEQIGLASVLIVLMLSFGTVAGAGVPPLIPSSEQRIASMQINRSAGNMTGDDYIVALVFAYINDSEGRIWNVDKQDRLPNYEKLYEETKAKFPEYGLLGDPYNIGPEAIPRILFGMMLDSGTRSPTTTGGYSITYVMPLQGYIDKAIYDIFDPDKYIISPSASTKAYARLKEEARQQAMQREGEAKQQAAQQENEIKQRAAQQEKMYNQLALDAHYKNLSANYTANLTILLNQSNFADALNLSNDAIKNLVSPYSNIMMISKGDIYTSMGRFEDAIQSDQNAQKEFTYDNESADYQNKVQQDFKRDWNTIVLYKTNLARQKLNDQIIAKKHDLRNAPNVNQLLSGHNGGRKYSVNVENDSYIGGGYLVSINLSAVNKPIDPTNKTDVYIKTSDDTRTFVQICIDMFGGLFADNRVAYACIQNNETYLDRFGHENEVAVSQACMDNKTATRVGNWNDFKQYVGTDMNKLSSVASMKPLVSSSSSKA
jgi:hypothetical protein